LQESKIILANRVYIPAHLIINKSLFKKTFTKIVNDEVHLLFKYHRVQDVFSVGIGYLDYLFPYLHEHEVVDMRLENKLDITCGFIGELRPEQKEVLNEWVEAGKTSGTLVARAGAGKTCMMSWLISHMQQKTLILVPTERILVQWKASIYQFLGVTPGIIGGGQFSVEDITVASYKSLTSKKGQLRLKEIQNNFGLIIIDEAHKACAPGWKNLIDSLPAKHKVACTATRFRKDKLIFYLDSLVTTHVVTMNTDTAKKAAITIVKTATPFFFSNPKDYVKALDSISKDKIFNTMVAKRIAADHIRGRYIIVLSPRIEQLEAIGEVLDSLEIPNGRLLSATNQTVKHNNEMLIEEAKNNRWVLLATDTLVGTGFDVEVLDSMHIPYSFNNEGNFIQYVGRIERKHDGKPQPEFTHYFFKDNGMSRAQQTTMQGLYVRLGYEVNFDESNLPSSSNKASQIKTSNWNF